MHGLRGAGTQAGSTVSHIGIQCELLLPPVITSTSTKANATVHESNISDISDVDDDNDNYADIPKHLFIKKPPVHLSLHESNLQVEK